LFCLGEGYFVENPFLPKGKKGSAMQPQNRDRFCGLPKSRVRQIILGTARGGQNYADGEYPPVHNKARTIQKPPKRVVFLFCVGEGYSDENAFLPKGKKGSATVGRDVLDAPST